MSDSIALEMHADRGFIGMASDLLRHLHLQQRKAQKARS